MRERFVEICWFDTLYREHDPRLAYTYFDLLKEAYTRRLFVDKLLSLGMNVSERFVDKKPHYRTKYCERVPIYSDEIPYL